MSTYRISVCAIGMKADRALSAAFLKRSGIQPTPENGGHLRLSFVQELPVE